MAARDLDHAVALNDRGYSRADSPFGHALAAWDGEWDDDLVVEAWEMLARYKGQLAEGNILLPSPRQRAGAGQARQRLRAWKGDKELVVDNGEFRLAQRRQPSEAVTGRVWLDAGQICCSTEKFDPRFVADIRTVPGRRWDPDRKCWTVPKSAASQLADVLARHHLVIDPALQALLDGTGREPEPEPNRVEKTDDGWAVFFDYRPEAVVEAKAIPGRRWDPQRRCWVVPEEQAGRVRDFARRWGLLAPSGLEAAEDPLGRADTLRRSLSRAESAEALEVPGFAGHLRPYQAAAVRFVTADRRGVLVADDMGLGKTVEALAAIALEGHRRTVVVAPASVVSVWVDAVRHFLPSHDVAAWAGRSGEVTIPSAPGLVVMSYNVLPDRLSQGAEWGPEAVVFDEVHLAKNGKSKRGKAALAIAKGRRVLALSGTPVPNRPADLIQPLRLLDRLRELGGWEGFALRYCDAQRSRWGWDLSGASNLAELRERLRTFTVARKKSTVAPELIKLPRRVLAVEPEAEAFAEYRLAEAELVRYLAERAAEEAARDGRDPKEAMGAAVRKALAAEMLVRLSTLRRLIGAAKASAAIEVVRQILSDEPGGIDVADGSVQMPSKVLVFGRHREVLQRIAEALDAPLLTGETPVGERSAIASRFQDDSDTRVLVLSTIAGGVGLTLTAANHVVTVEYEWRSVDHDQAEDRACRIGQTRAVLPTYLVVPNTVDEEMGRLLAEKSSAIAQILDGSTDQASHASGPGDLAEAAVSWLLARGTQPSS